VITHPRCWGCSEVVDDDPIFEALCGHDECPSVVWHPMCLMRWREHLEESADLVRLFIFNHPLFQPDQE